MAANKDREIIDLTRENEGNELMSYMTHIHAAHVAAYDEQQTNALFSSGPPTSVLGRIDRPHTPVAQQLETSQPSQKSSYVRWCFTWNNYIERDKLLLKEFAENTCIYLIYGEEVGESGTPHLQGYFRAKKPLRFVQVKGMLGPQVHLEVAKSDDQKNVEYCSKDGKVTEFGERPEFNNNGEREKNRWAEGLDLAKRGKLEEVDPQLQISFWGNLNKIRVAYQPKVDEIGQLENHWFYGAPGTGKSTEARRRWPDLFSKPQNKWWDGYQAQATVLIDDYDEGGRGLGHYVKIWADKFPFQAEIKGCSLNIRPARIVVTSNYPIEELWADEPEMAAAIRRRFKVTRFAKLGEQVVEKEGTWISLQLPRAELIRPETPNLPRTAKVIPATPEEDDEEDDEFEEHSPQTKQELGEFLHRHGALVVRAEGVGSNKLQKKVETGFKPNFDQQSLGDVCLQEKLKHDVFEASQML